MGPQRPDPKNKKKEEEEAVPGKCLFVLPLKAVNMTGRILHRLDENSIGAELVSRYPYKVSSAFLELLAC